MPAPDAGTHDQLEERHVRRTPPPRIRDRDAITAHPPRTTRAPGTPRADAPAPATGARLPAGTRARGDRGRRRRAQLVGVERGAHPARRRDALPPGAARRAAHGAADHVRPPACPRRGGRRSRSGARGRALLIGLLVLVLGLGGGFAIGRATADSGRRRSPTRCTRAPTATSRSATRTGRCSSCSSSSTATAASSQRLQNLLGQLGRNGTGNGGNVFPLNPGNNNNGNGNNGNNNNGNGNNNNGGNNTRRRRRRPARRSSVWQIERRATDRAS